MTEHDIYHPRRTDAVEFHPERKKMFFFASISALFVLLGFLLTGLGGKGASLAGWLMVFLFGGFAISAGLIALLQRARLVVSDQGVEVLGSAAGLIEWSEVKQIQISEVRNTQFISLVLYDPKAYRDRLPLTRRLLAGIDENLTGAHVSLPGAGLNAPRDEIKELMVQRLMKYRKTHQLGVDLPEQELEDDDEPGRDEIDQFDEETDA